MPSGEQQARCVDRAAGEHGYNLVVLTMIITVLNIWIAATLPLWSHQIQRDKEAELIFRGLQYAEAIRVFQTRFSRYPTSLQELIEVEPRCIRQLYENPMRDDGRWGLIPAGAAPGAPGQPGQRVGGQGRGDTGLEGAVNADGTPIDRGPDGQNKPQVLLSRDTNDPFAPPGAAVPIRGVFSPDGPDETVRFYMGSNSVVDWQFTVELVSHMLQGTPDDPTFVRPFPVANIGLPWPRDVQPQVAQPSPNPRPQQQAPLSPGSGAGIDASQGVGPGGVTPGGQVAQPPSQQPPSQQPPQPGPFGGQG